MIDVSDLIGVQFVRGGADPAKGLDCLGLMLEVHRRMDSGLTLPDFDYSLGWKGRVYDYFRENSERFKEVKLVGARAGDIVVIEGKSDDPLHVGVMISRSQMIHAIEGGGVALQRPSAYEGFIQKVLRYE